MGIQITEDASTTFETDCLQLVNLVKGIDECPWNLIFILDQIEKAFDYNNFTILHIEREGNSGADYLANLGCDKDPIISTNLDDFPSNLKGIIRTEAWGVSYLRIKR